MYRHREESRTRCAHKMGSAASSRNTYVERLGRADDAKDLSSTQVDDLNDRHQQSGVESRRNICCNASSGNEEKRDTRYSERTVERGPNTEVEVYSGSSIRNWQ